MKKQLLLILALVIFKHNLQAVETLHKRALEDYYFILLMPTKHTEQTDYLAAIFALNDLKVCRFPGGPLLSNSVALNELYNISNQEYLKLNQVGYKLAILCLDYSAFKLDCQNDCQQNICGFALPWESGKAYVFDDLTQIDKVLGILIEKTQLAQIELTACLKKIECVEDQSSLLIIDELDFDAVDSLLESNTDELYDSKQLSDTAQSITNFFGKIAITLLMGYHDIKQKIIKILSIYYARSET